MMSAENRYYSWHKALRKQRITQQGHGYTPENPLYDNLHQFSKNKVHCSCCICSEKSRNKGKRKHLAGPYKPALNYPISDKKRMASMEADRKEYFEIYRAGQKPMKYAYYEVVANEAEKQHRLTQIDTTFASDNDFCGAYLEVAPRYNASNKKKPALLSLLEAVDLGEVQILVLASLENLYMSEENIRKTLNGFLCKGVRIAIGTPGNLQSVKVMSDQLMNSQMDYILDHIHIPLVTMEDCLIRHKKRSAEIYLLRDFPEKKPRPGFEKMTFIDAVNQYQETGFRIFRKDLHAWYPVSPAMAEMMLQIFDTTYETLWDSILPPPTPKAQLSQETLDLINSVDWTDL